MLWQLAGNRDPDLPPASPLADGLESLARELFLPVGFLERIMELLEDRRQVILQGPRGTGKTHMARNLAKLPSGDEGRVTRSEAFGRPWGHFSNAQVCRGLRAATGYNLYNLHFYCKSIEV